jgi:hypothetical protein
VNFAKLEVLATNPPLDLPDLPDGAPLADIAARYG